MNRAAIEKCKALQARVVEVQEAAVAKAENIILESKVLVYDGEDILIEKMTEYPVYPEKGDVLYYDVKLQTAVPVKLYNMNTRSTVKSYNKTIVKSNFFFSTFKKFSFQPISAACIQHKVGHFCYSL